MQHCSPRVVHRCGYSLWLFVMLRLFAALLLRLQLLHVRVARFDIPACKWPLAVPVGTH